jgi:eukaryotic translation initiation factor 2C
MELPANETIRSGSTIPPPDPIVTKLEDDIVKAQAQPLSKVTAQMGKLTISGAISSKDSYFPQRPAYGSNGQRVILWTNSFKLTIQPRSLHKYAIDISRVPMEDSKAKESPREVKGRKLQIILQDAVKELRKADPGCVIATEFKSQLVSLKPLKVEGNAVSVVFQGQGSQRKETWTVKFNGPTEAPVDDLVSYTTTMIDNSDPSGQNFPKFAHVVDALGVVLGHSPRSNGTIASVGSARFYPHAIPNQNSTELRDGGYGSRNDRGLSAVRGYFQSVRLGTGRVLVNTNVTHGVFRTEALVSEFCQWLGITVMQQDQRQFMRRLREADKLLQRCRVQVNILDDKNKQIPIRKTVLGLACRDNIRSKMKNPPKFLGPQQNRYTGPNELEFYMESQPEGTSLKPGYISVAKYFFARMEFRVHVWS